MSDDCVQMKVEELMARYELEPALRDVFVEGVFDKDVLSHGLSVGPHAECVFYEIDVVDISAAALKKYGLTSGNKQRVMALANELAALDGDFSYRCVVDRDLDHWFGALREIKGLRWTEFASIELYFLETELVQEYLVVAAKAKIRSWAEFYSSFVIVLRKLYLIRVALQALDWIFIWPEWTKSLSVANGCVVFDSCGYEQKLLLRNGKIKESVKLQEALIKWDAVLIGDDRVRVRGHDFIDLMAWCVGKFKGVKAYADSEAIGRLLVFTSNRVKTLERLVE